MVAGSDGEVVDEDVADVLGGTVGVDHEVYEGGVSLDMRHVVS